MSSSDILLIIEMFFMFVVPALAVAYFAVSLILFIISGVKLKNGATGGLAARRPALKVHLIISSVILGVAAAVAAVLIAMLYIAIAHM